MSAKKTEVEFLTNVKHNDKRYSAGDTAKFTNVDLEILKAAGVVREK